MKKYTGVLAPKNFELVRDDLEKKHLLDLAPSPLPAGARRPSDLVAEGRDA